MWSEGLSQRKLSMTSIGNRTRCLPAFSAVPQTNAPPCTLVELDRIFISLSARRSGSSAHKIVRERLAVETDENHVIVI